jgi:hypothetical protein
MVCYSTFVETNIQRTHYKYKCKFRQQWKRVHHFLSCWWNGCWSFVSLPIVGIDFILKFRRYDKSWASLCFNICCVKYLESRIKEIVWWQIQWCYLFYLEIAVYTTQWKVYHIVSILTAKLFPTCMFVLVALSDWNYFCYYACWFVRNQPMGRQWREANNLGFCAGQWCAVLK